MTPPSASAQKSNTTMAGVKRRADIAFADDRIVEFTVGPANTTFAVHRNKLVHSIRHFIKSVGENAPFQEGQTLKVNLPDVNPKTFELLVTWIYTGKLEPIRVPDKKLQKNDPAAWQNLMQRSYSKEALYFNLMYKAEYWHCKPLCHAILDEIRNFHSVTDTTVPDNLLWDGITNEREDSGLRKILVAQLCIRCTEGEDVVADIMHKSEKALGDKRYDVMTEVVKTLGSWVTRREVSRKSMKALLLSSEDWYAEMKDLHSEDAPANSNEGELRRGMNI